MSSRVVKAVHGVQQVTQDPPDEIAESSRLREREPREALVERYAGASFIDSADGARQRRMLMRALCQSFGHGVRIGRGAIGSHFETFEIGDGVFIGEQSFIQGRADGRCIIGDHAWIGPQSYLDAAI